MNTKQDIIRLFGINKSFTKNDLLNYYLQTETEVNNNTLLYRISKLKSSNIIKSIGRGVYIVTDKIEFKQEPDKLQKRISKLFLSKYNDINFCTWSSSSLYGFMVHQPFISFYIFEVENEVMKETFNLFKDNGLNAFYQPEKDMIDDYLSYTKNAIIIKPLISRSPIYTMNAVRMASIEKILVDIYYDRNIYPVFNISEQKNIIENVFDNYILNTSKINSYSSRRNKENEYVSFIKNNFENIFK